MRFKYFNETGQGLVEFALVLAFCAAVLYGADTFGLRTAIAGLYPPGAKVLREIDHFKDYDVNIAIRDIESFQKNGNYQEAATANHVHYERGYIRSGWVDKHPNDANREKIKQLRDELGASQWTYLNGLGKNYNNKPSTNGYYIGDLGMYWTTDTLRASMLTVNSTAESSNFSNELVLQYFYSTISGKYYVIKSYVWVNQADVANHVALSGLHLTYKKPAGYFVEGCYEGFDTIAEAKELFERTREANGYSVIFRDGPIESDVCATDYLMVGNEFKHT